MEYLYLLLAMTCSASYTVMGRIYTIRNASKVNVSGLFNVLTPAFASLFWLAFWLTDFSFDPAVLIYSLLYSVTFCLFAVGMMGALNNGSTSVTALVKQLALVGVSFWGFAFWQTPFSPATGVGIALIVASLALCLLTKQNTNEKKSLWKWALYAMLIIVGNAGCSIIQKYQQMTFDYQHKNMFMFFALLFATVFCVFLAQKEDKTNWLAAAKTSWVFPLLAGASAAFNNVCVLLLIDRNVSAAVIYPCIAVGGLMITTIVSFLGFRERLRPQQWLGLAIGAVALALLNL